MKGVSAFAVFLLFLAGIAIFNLRNMAERGANLPAPPSLAELTDNTWLLQRIADAVVSRDARIELQFAADDRLQLHGACNRYNGTYRYLQGRLQVASLAGTRRACEPDIMAADAHMLDVLNATQSAKSSGSALLLYDDSEALLATLRRLPPATENPREPAQ